MLRWTISKRGMEARPTIALPNKRLDVAAQLSEVSIHVRIDFLLRKSGYLFCSVYSRENEAILRERGCLPFTNMVKCGEDSESFAMKVKKTAKTRIKAESNAQIRATLSFPPEIYESLKDIARQKRVSLAWVVRDAAEQYLTDKWPLFGKKVRDH